LLIECFRHKSRCTSTILLLEYFQTQIKDVNLLHCSTHKML